MAREAENLTRWIRSGEPERWVAARRGQWNHHDWLALLDALRRSPYWPMDDADIGRALDEAREDMMWQAAADPGRPVSAVMSAMIITAARNDAVAVRRLRRFLLDPEDAPGGRWEVLRLAERDSWRAVQLLLLRRGIERRFREGDLDSWEQQTPSHADLRAGLEGFYRCYEGVTFPDEPKAFTAFAFQELQAARLCGLLHAECVVPEDGVLGLADEVGERFPVLARLLRLPGLDIPGMALGFLHDRLGLSEELRREFVRAGFDPPSSVTGACHLPDPFVRYPDDVEEFVGDLHAEVTLKDRLLRKEALAKIRQPLTPQQDAEVEREARTEVERLLGRSEVIHATTLADALTQAEKLKEAHDLTAAINSLWAWYCRLPADRRTAIGSFDGRHAKHRLWATARSSRQAAPREG
jgi:hypothetical protein